MSLFILAGALHAQDKKDEPFGVEGQFTFETERPYKLLELDERTEEPIVTKKKKPKKKENQIQIKNQIQLKLNMTVEKG